MAALSRTKSWIVLAAVTAMTVGFCGCGVKGPLEPPPDAKVAGEAKSPDAHDPGQNSDAPKQPHQDFVLDPLLR
jgi:predicted small lipoprotein YifL